MLSSFSESDFKQAAVAKQGRTFLVAVFLADDWLPLPVAVRAVAPVQRASFFVSESFVFHHSGVGLTS